MNMTALEKLKTMLSRPVRSALSMIAFIGLTSIAGASVGAGLGALGSDTTATQDQIVNITDAKINPHAGNPGAIPMAYHVQLGEMGRQVEKSLKLLEESVDRLDAANHTLKSSGKSPERAELKDKVTYAKAVVEERLSRVDQSFEEYLEQLESTGEINENGVTFHKNYAKALESMIERGQEIAREVLLDVDQDAPAPRTPRMR